MQKKLPKNFPDLLRRTREKYDLELDDVARMLQVSQNTLNRWEKGIVIPTGDNRKRVELWIILANEPHVENIIHNMLKEPSGVLNLGGFFGTMAGVSNMVDRMCKGVLEGMVAPEGALMKALHEFHKGWEPKKKKLEELCL
ncbi:helix-turn-helix domain-containing protein [Desulfonatronum parangueonense]